MVNSCFFGGNFKSGVGKFPTETVDHLTSTISAFVVILYTARDFDTEFTGLYLETFAVPGHILGHAYDFFLCTSI